MLFFLISIRANATHPLLLISIDGMRPDYINSADSPNILALAADGTRAQSLRSVFPTLTFPNHFTIVTGDYPEHHGIVGNEIRDPNMPMHFNLSAPKEVVNDPRWWLGEPIWVTAQKQNLKSGTLFWPGSEAKIQNILPSYYLVYDQTMTNMARVDQLLAWVDLPTERRPQFYTLYFDTVDTVGHHAGPQSQEVKDALKEVDAAIGHLVAELRRRDVFQDFNIIIVSDHGMVLYDQTKSVNISDVLASFPHVDKIGGGAVAGLFSNDPAEVANLAELLKEKSNLYTVYKKAEIPARFHYNEGVRIPDLLLVATEGANIGLKPSFAPTLTPTIAGHGYDNELASMQASFIAHGPSFRVGAVTQTFDNIHVYALMCHLLGILPAPNDGSYDKLPPELRDAR